MGRVEVSINDGSGIGNAVMMYAKRLINLIPRRHRVVSPAASQWHRSGHHGTIVGGIVTGATPANDNHRYNFDVVRQSVFRRDIFPVYR